jgi:regulation of enolase protein 1 (concanavalin A-like superfamily)
MTNDLIWRRSLGPRLVVGALVGVLLLSLTSWETAGAQTGAAPNVDVWYGDVQSVGAQGRSQQWANVLGRVTDPDGAVVSLEYTLNGGAPRPLTIGTGGNPRLARQGDFNAEIDRDELVAGDNAVAITATDDSGSSTTRTVTLQNTPGQSWPLPTTASWSGASLPTDVADVVDGRWTVGPSGVTPLDRTYDRLFAIGDETWTDYEVEVPVTIHEMDGNTGGVGVFLRWTGHTEAPPHVPGMQPRVGWRPSGALAWYRSGFSHPTRLQLANDDESLLAADTSGFTLTSGVTYTFRASVVRTSEGDLYRLTAFPQGQPESSGVTISAVDTQFRKAAGSVLFIANRAIVTYGDITVTPIEPPSGPVNVAPVAVGDSVSTVVDVPVAVDVLANDSDSDGSLVASSVVVVDQPVNGSVVVDPVSGVVTYTPGSGFSGSDGFAYTVADDDGAVSNVASVSVTVDAEPVPPPSGGLVSDEFSGSSLGSQWSWFDPRGDSSVTASGGAARLSVPAGVSHNLWSNALWAPRLLQDAEDVDFEVEVKIDSPVSQRYQLQGLVVHQDIDDLLRAEFHHDGSSTRVYVASFTGGQASVKVNVVVPFTASYWMRLARVGDVWTVAVSDDGVSWQAMSSFVHAMAVSEMGIFVGNHNPNPAHTAVFDHFRVLTPA